MITSTAPFARALQALAILFLGLMGAVIAHKATADIIRLASLHEGIAFWNALVRYFFANLAG